MRIAIAEDHVLYRQVLVGICRQFGHIVVKASDCASEILQTYMREPFDMLCLDLRLKDTPGGALVEMLGVKEKLPKILIISGNLAPYVVYRMDRLPTTTGYLHKQDATLAAMKVAISSVSSGQRWLSASYVNLQRRLSTDADSFSKLLTTHQQLFLRYIAAEFSDDVIAIRMGVSRRTIEGHRSAVMRKLGISNATQLAIYSKLQGFDLFPPSDQNRCADDEEFHLKNPSKHEFPPDTIRVVEE